METQSEKRRLELSQLIEKALKQAYQDAVKLAEQTGTKLVTPETLKNCSR